VAKFSKRTPHAAGAIGYQSCTARKLQRFTGHQYHESQKGFRSSKLVQSSHTELIPLVHDDNNKQLT